MRELDALLRQWKADAEALRRHGDTRAAGIIERFAGEVYESAEEWLDFLTEADAILRSGRSAAWLRQRREAWKREGHARQVARHEWTYRAAIIPRRRSTLLAAEAGRAAARRSRAAA